MMWYTEFDESDCALMPVHRQEIRQKQRYLYCGLRYLACVGIEVRIYRIVVYMQGYLTHTHIRRHQHGEDQNQDQTR